jgi:hypothetical protein
MVRENAAGVITFPGRFREPGSGYQPEKERQAPMRAMFSYAVLCVCLSANAVHAGDEYFVLAGGLNLARFNYSSDGGGDGPAQDFRTAPAVQIGFQAPVGSNATLLSLGLETRGSDTHTGALTGSDAIFHYRFNYAQIQFQFKWLIGKSGMPAGYLAPSIGTSFLIGAEGELGGESRDISESASSFDMEAGLALGVQFPIDRHALFVEGGYGYGLFDVRDESASSSSLKNSVIKLRIGLLYGLI